MNWWGIGVNSDCSPAQRQSCGCLMVGVRRCPSRHFPEEWSERVKTSGGYLVCQFREVLLCVADNISHSEDGAVGVVDHVEVALFDVVVSDGGEKVPSAQTPERITAVRASAMPRSQHSDLLGVVEDWEADAVLNENSEILHFHHWRPEKELKQGKQRKGGVGIRFGWGFLILNTSRATVVGGFLHVSGCD